MPLLIFRYFLDSRSPFLFKKWLTDVQGKSTRSDTLIYMEELRHKTGLRVAERIIVFEIASHFS